MPRRQAIVTGGGTSGHVLPALALLEGLEDAGVPVSSLGYVGCRRGVERALLPTTPYAATYLPIAGLQRSMSVQSMLKNLLLPFRVVVSYGVAIILALRWRPGVVVSVGGYASAPMAFAARVVRAPLVCVTYDAIPGLATRRQARHAALVASAFPGSTLRKSVHTGAPVRRVVRNMDVARSRDAARRELGFPNDVVLVTVMGGSQGSAILNHVVPDMLKVLSRGSRPVAVLHLCGHRFADEPQAAVPTNSALVEYRRAAYESRMNLVLAATDVMVCRAGAGTVAEIATVGIAAILVPWKDAADDHQRLNAEWLARDGGAILIDEVGMSSDDIARHVASLVVDDGARRRLAEAAWRRGEANRSGALTRAVLSVVAGGSRQFE